MPVPRMHIDEEAENCVSFVFKEESLYDDEDEGLVDVTEQGEEVAAVSQKARAVSTGPAICEAANCSKVALYRCSRCESAWYCSSKCQRSAWKSLHRNACVAAESAKPRKEIRLGEDDEENPPEIPEENIVIEASCAPLYASRGDDDDDE